MGPVTLHMLFQERDDVVCGRDFFAAIGLAQIRYELGGGFDADIVFYEGFFEVVEQVIVDVSAYGKHRRQRRTDFIASFA